jgi:hypothetical protein
MVKIVIRQRDDMRMFKWLFQIDEEVSQMSYKVGDHWDFVDCDFYSCLCSQTMTEGELWSRNPELTTILKLKYNDYIIGIEEFGDDWSGAK